MDTPTIQLQHIGRTYRFLLMVHGLWINAYFCMHLNTIDVPLEVADPVQSCALCTLASGRRKTSFHGALSLYGYDGGQGRSEASVDQYAWLMDLAMQGPYDDGEWLMHDGISIIIQNVVSFSKWWHINHYPIIIIQLMMMDGEWRMIVFFLQMSDPRNQESTFHGGPEPVNGLKRSLPVWRPRSSWKVGGVARDQLPICLGNMGRSIYLCLYWYWYTYYTQISFEEELNT